MECDCIPPPPPLFDLPPPPDPSLIWHLLSPQGDEDGVVVDGKVLFDTCDAALKEGAEGTWPFNILLTSSSFPTSPSELWSRGDAVYLLLSVLFLALLVGCLTATCVLRRKRLRQRRKHSTSSPSSLESSKCSTKTVATAANTTTTRIVERLPERGRFPSNFAAHQQPGQQQHHCHPSALSATVARRVFAVPIRCGHHPTAINYPSSYGLSGGGGNVYGGSQRRTVRMYGSQSSTNIFTHGGHPNMPCAAVECVHCPHAPYVQPNSYRMQQHGNLIGKRMMCPPASSCCSVSASNRGYCTLLGSGDPLPSATELYEEISTSGHCCPHQHGGDTFQQSPPIMRRMSRQQPWMPGPMLVDCSDDNDDDGDREGERVCDDDGLSPTVFEDLSESIRRFEEDADRLHVARRPPPPGPPPPPPPPLQSLHAQIDFNTQPAGYSVPPPAAAGDPVGSMDSLEEGGETHHHHHHNSSSVGRPSSGDTELERLAAGTAGEGGKGHHPVSFGGSPPNPAESKSGESQMLERSPLSTGSNGGGCGGRESGYGTGGNRPHYVVGKSQLQSSVAQNTPPIPQRRPKRDEGLRSEEIPLQLSPPARTVELSSREGTNAAQPGDVPDGLAKNRSITYV